jgi:hypothetical protein
LLAHLDVAAAERLFPKHVAFYFIEAPEEQIVAIGDIEKDAVAPDDRGRAAPTPQRGFPNHVLFGGPLNGQVLFAARAVEVRPTPLRPVVSTRGRKRKCENQQHTKNTFTHL